MVVEMLAPGLAISVIVDATVVRLVLVPSAVSLLGRANWWIPRGLDRLLPRLRARARLPAPPCPDRTAGA